MGNINALYRGQNFTTLFLIFQALYSFLSSSLIFSEPWLNLIKMSHLIFSMLNNNIFLPQAIPTVTINFAN